MKKIIALCFLLFFTLSLSASNGGVALKACKKYFRYLQQGALSSALKLTTGSVENEWKALLKKDATQISAIKKVLATTRYYFTKIKIRKRRAKIFVLSITKKGELTLSKFYMKIKRGGWKVYRYRRMPFSASLP